MAHLVSVEYAPLNCSQLFTNRSGDGASRLKGTALALDSIIDAARRSRAQRSDLDLEAARGSKPAP